MSLTANDCGRPVLFLQRQDFYRTDRTEPANRFVDRAISVYLSLIYFVQGRFRQKNLAVCNSRNRGVRQMALSDYTLAYRGSDATKKCRHVCNPTAGKPS